MSPRAAWRLESLGFAEVYDYAPSKADWMAWGLPREGRSASIPTVGEVSKRDVPTCSLTDTVGDARDRARAPGSDLCAVVTGDGVVLGLLRGEQLDSDPRATVEQVMRPGPTTYHLGAKAPEAAERMQERRVSALLVTTPDGVLVGVLRREDAERAADGTGGS